MPLVNIMVNNRAYAVACDEGEEDHLRELATQVDGKVRELMGSVGQVGDARLILMAALLIADDCVDATTKLGQLTQEMGEISAARDRMDDALSSTQTNALSAPMNCFFCSGGL